MLIIVRWDCLQFGQRNQNWDQKQSELFVSYQSVERYIFDTAPDFFSKDSSSQPGVEGIRIDANDVCNISEHIQIDIGYVKLRT